MLRFTTLQNASYMRPSMLESQYQLHWSMEVQMVVRHSTQGTAA
jgi:hypothetical protein